MPPSGVVSSLGKCGVPETLNNGQHSLAARKRAQCINLTWTQIETLTSCLGSLTIETQTVQLRICAQD